MNSFTTKKYLILAALSLVLSLGTIRWHSQDGVPFCVHSAGCSATQTLRGKVTTRTYGFPATYRQVEIFNPANTNPSSGGYAGYKQATAELEGFSVPKVIVNMIFWFALLLQVGRFIKQRKPAAPRDITVEPPVLQADPESNQPSNPTTPNQTPKV